MSKFDGLYLFQTIEYYNTYKIIKDYPKAL